MTYVMIGAKNWGKMAFWCQTWVRAYAKVFDFAIDGIGIIGEAE